MHATDVLRQTSPGVTAKLSKASVFILEHGWAAATIRHYAAAVNRYFFFIGKTRPHLFPASSSSIYDFICWCHSNEDDYTVLATTVKRYLTGLRMWHVLHDARFPTVNEHRIRLLLKAARKLESRPVSTRTGFTLSDIHRLVKDMDLTSQSNLVLRGVILVGFWGLARLGELTLANDHLNVFICRRDLRFNADKSHATVRIRLAKTATPGEDQYLHLSSQPNMLNPLKALLDILEMIPGSKNDPLFPRSDLSGPICRSTIISYFNTLKAGRGKTFSGHSLRIGGASLRAHYGNATSSLQKAGRWRSSCYKLYIHEYDEKTAKKTKLLARDLRLSYASYL